MIVFAVCIHLKNSTITPPKCTVLCFKGWKVKNTTLSNVVYTIMHIIFIRYLKKEKKMTTPPTRFHQNNKIIRYIHTKNCQNHSPFTNPHQSFYFWSKGVTRSKFIQLFLTIYITVLMLLCDFGIRQQLPIKFCKKTPSGTSVAQNSLFSQIYVKRAKYKNFLI